MILFLVQNITPALAVLEKDANAKFFKIRFFS